MLTFGSPSPKFTVFYGLNLLCYCRRDGGSSYLDILFSVGYMSQPIVERHRCRGRDVGVYTIPSTFPPTPDLTWWWVLPFGSPLPKFIISIMYGSHWRSDLSRLRYLNFHPDWLHLVSPTEYSTTQPEPRIRLWWYNAVWYEVISSDHAGLEQP